MSRYHRLSAVWFSLLTDNRNMSNTVVCTLQFVKRGSDGKFVANIRLHGARTGPPDRTPEIAVETDSKQEVSAIAEAAEQQPAAVQSDPCLPPDLRRFASLIALVRARRSASLH